MDSVLKYCHSLSDTLNKWLYEWWIRSVGQLQRRPCCHFSQWNHMFVFRPPSVTGNWPLNGDSGYSIEVQHKLTWSQLSLYFETNLRRERHYWSLISWKTSLKAHKIMSENIQTLENIVVRPGATMSPMNVAWLACNHIRTRGGTRRGSRVCVCVCVCVCVLVGGSGCVLL